MDEQRDRGDPDRSDSHARSAVPGPVTAWVLAALSVIVLGTSYWLALQPGAAAVQTRFMKWINDPPPPLGTVLAVTNLLFRPAPLTVVALLLFGWMMFTARGGSRWEVLRAIVISCCTGGGGRAEPQAGCGPEPTDGVDSRIGRPRLPQGPLRERLPVGAHERRRRSCHGAVALADLAAAGGRGDRRGSRGPQPPVHRGTLADRRGRWGSHRSALRGCLLAGGREMADRPPQRARGRAQLNDLAGLHVPRRANGHDPARTLAPLPRVARPRHPGFRSAAEHLAGRRSANATRPSSPTGACDRHGDQVSDTSTACSPDRPCRDGRVSR